MIKAPGSKRDTEQERARTRAVRPWRAGAQGKWGDKTTENTGGRWLLEELRLPVI